MAIIALHPWGKTLGVRHKNRQYVSRGGDKLSTALQAFDVDTKGKIAADLGANVGGFTDCLLDKGVSRIYAVDTAYGLLDWRLRKDARVVTLERTNALHVVLPEPVDLVTVDVGWTRQRMIVPLAVTLLKADGWIVSLLKPQYEAEAEERRGGVVISDRLPAIVQRVVTDLKIAGIPVVARVESSITGSGGNREFFLLVQNRATE